MGLLTMAARRETCRSYTKACNAAQGQPKDEEEIGHISRDMYIFFTAIQLRIMFQRRREHHTESRYIAVRETKYEQNEQINDIRIDNGWRRARWFLEIAHKEEGYEESAS